jgi:RND family efflux transporter MFP subunit
MRPANLLRIALLAVLLLWSCSKENQLNDSTTQPVLSGVELLTIRRQSVEQSIPAVGTVKSLKSSILSSKISGTITSILVREGNRVKQGQLLIELDDRDLRADLDQARAAADEAGAAVMAAQSAVTSAQEQNELAAITFKRYEALVTKGLIAVQDFDEVSAKHKVAHAELERASELLRAARAKQTQMAARVAYAQTLLSYAKITSPYDGLVTAKNAEVGTMAALGVPLLSVEQSGPYRLEVQVGESSLAGVTAGKTVPVVIDALKTDLSGRVSEVVPAADPQTRTFTIKIELPRHPALRSGLYGRAYFAGDAKDALLAPVTALIEKGQLTAVYTVNDKGIVELRLVTVGARYGAAIEILSGLTEGDRMVIRGMEKITPGSRVAATSAK